VVGLGGSRSRVVGSSARLPANFCTPALPLPEGCGGRSGATTSHYRWRHHLTLPHHRHTTPSPARPSSSQMRSRIEGNITVEDRIHSSWSACTPRSLRFLQASRKGGK